MYNEQDDINELNLTVSSFFLNFITICKCLFLEVIKRVSSVDSLEPTDGENLRFISGYHKWINTNSSVRVDNDRPVEIVSISDDDRSIVLKTLSTTNTEKIFVRHPLTNEEEEEEEDYSLTQMDISANQFEFDHRSIHYEIFSSDFEKKSTEMEVDNGENQSDETNQQSTNTKKKKTNSESDESNYRQRNGENPNRNNNNSRR